MSVGKTPTIQADYAENSSIIAWKSIVSTIGLEAQERLKFSKSMVKISSQIGTITAEFKDIRNKIEEVHNTISGCKNKIFGTLTTYKDDYQTACETVENARSQMLNAIEKRKTKTTKTVKKRINKEGYVKERVFDVFENCKQNQGKVLRKRHPSFIAFFPRYK